MRTTADVELAPDNWFSAWWLQGQERQPTRLAKDAGGRPLLLGLPYAELKLVEAVLVRAWCDGPKDWAAPEWAELRAFDDQVLAHLDDLRRRRQPDEAATGVSMAFPPLEHGMFAPEAACHLLAEAWRLERHEGFVAWLAAAVVRRGFAGRARHNVHLRRMAIELARRAPGPGVFEVLRRVYRDRKHREPVIAADLEFLQRVPGADSFRSGIAELGLHAGLAEERFPMARRPRRQPRDVASPRITVVIPSYRHEAYVVDAITSCLRQTIHDVRVLVADDCSPDGTVAAAKSIDDPRLRVEINPQNLGLGASVLAALQRVDTPFVALLNSDDLFHPERLERCLRQFEQDPGASLVATGFSVVDRDGAVLTDATACAAEVGPKAHRWLRWFEAIQRDELREPGDWVSFEVLLRHNILATSSNMVFRTDWLREHMPEASRLKYCLDWQLFLQAAMEGALRLVGEPLLAYRLHDANTVWFREGGRADYVLEVNRVVDRVLGQWLQRAVTADGPARAVERLAALLEADVLRHGEADGLALYFSDLVRRLAAGAVDPAVHTVAELAEAALRRSTWRQVMQGLQVDPWSLPWRAEAAELWRVEHDCAEGFSARARALQEDVTQLRADLAVRERLLGEQRSSCERLAADLAAAAAELSALRAEAAGAAAAAAAAAAELRAKLVAEQQALVAARAATEEAKGEVARLDEALAALRQGLADATDREAGLRRDIVVAQQAGANLAAERDAQARQLEGLQAQLADWMRRHAELDAESTRSATRIAALEDQNGKLGADLRELRSHAAVQAEELRRLAGELGTARARIADLELEVARLRQQRDEALASGAREGRVRDLAVAALLAAQSAAVAQSSSPAWRLGNVLARRVGVLQIYKTMAALSRRGAAVLQRAGWHVHRSTVPAARQRQGAVLFAAPGAEGAVLRRERFAWTVLPDVPRHRLGGTADLSATVRAELATAARASGARCAWIEGDPRLEAADRAYFAARNRSGTAHLEAAFAATGWLGGAWRAARAAKALGAGFAVAIGLGPAALNALVSRQLIGLRYALWLGDEDLVHPPVDAATAAALLGGASLWVGESERVLRAAAQMAGAEGPPMVVRWALPPLPELPPPPAAKQFRVLVDWTAPTRADEGTLVEGVARAVAGGLDVRVDVVGTFGRDAAAVARQLAFVESIAARGLGERIRCHGSLPPAAAKARLAAADAALWVGRQAPAAGLPFAVVDALVHGRPVVASAVQDLLWVPALAETLHLVPPGDAVALAEALAAVAAGPALARQRLDAGRAVLARRAADDSARLPPWPHA